LTVLTGIAGLLKFGAVVVAVVGYLIFNWLALWAYGIILLVVLNHNYAWDLAIWQIFLAGGLWYLVSMLVSVPLDLLILHFQPKKNAHPVNTGTVSHDVEAD
jgi:hypothetical protein